MAGFSNEIFWIVQKRFYMDDGLLCGTPDSIKTWLNLIERLETTSGLKLKWVKMSVHAPDAASAEFCRQVLPDYINIIRDENMAFV